METELIGLLHESKLVKDGKCIKQYYIFNINNIKMSRKSNCPIMDRFLLGYGTNAIAYK